MAPEVPEPARRMATLSEVAKSAGVSLATASRVINDEPGVSALKIVKVRDAIRRLNYRPNRAARTLVNRRTMTIALVIPEDAVEFFGNPYFASVVTAISEELSESNYGLNLLLSGRSDASDKAVAYLEAGHLDGAIVISDYSGEHSLARLGATMPIVFAGRPAGEQAYPSYWVDVDNYNGARDAVTHLVDGGRRSIAMISGTPGTPVSADRIRGWREALGESGLEGVLIECENFSTSQGASAMRDLLAGPTAIDGVFAASDQLALGALGVLRGRHIEVPGEVAVVGFDDSPVAAASEIPLTTVRQPGEASGRLLARLVLELLRGADPPREHVLATELVVRSTA